MTVEPPVVRRKTGMPVRFGADPSDRRRRRRVKLAMPVHIRGGIGSTDTFEDVGKTIDASRDGLLVATGRRGYWTGQLLEVTLGCDAIPALADRAQKARVVRSTFMHNHRNLRHGSRIPESAGRQQRGRTDVSLYPSERGGCFLSNRTHTSRAKRAICFKTMDTTWCMQQQERTHLKFC